MVSHERFGTRNSKSAQIETPASGEGGKSFGYLCWSGSRLENYLDSIESEETECHKMHSKYNLIPNGVSSEDIQKARQRAKRSRVSIACTRCKSAKIRCSDYRPCKHCVDCRLAEFCVESSNDEPAAKTGRLTDDVAIQANSSDRRPDSFSLPQDTTTNVFDHDRRPSEAFSVQPVIMAFHSGEASQQTLYSNPFSTLHRTAQLAPAWNNQFVANMYQALPTRPQVTQNPVPPFHLGPTSAILPSPASHPPFPGLMPPILPPGLLPFAIPTSNQPTILSPFASAPIRLPAPIAQPIGFDSLLQHFLAPTAASPAPAPPYQVFPPPPPPQRQDRS